MKMGSTQESKRSGNCAISKCQIGLSTVLNVGLVLTRSDVSRQIVSQFCVLCVCVKVLQLCMGVHVDYLLNSPK